MTNRARPFNAGPPTVGNNVVGLPFCMPSNLVDCRSLLRLTCFSVWQLGVVDRFDQPGSPPTISYNQSVASLHLPAAATAIHATLKSVGEDRCAGW